MFLIIDYKLKLNSSKNIDYVYPTNPGNIANVTAGNPVESRWIKNSLGYYVSGWDSLGARVIWQGIIDNLSNCMKKCQETSNCIYVTYKSSESKCC